MLHYILDGVKMYTSEYVPDHGYQTNWPQSLFQTTVGAYHAAVKFAKRPHGMAYSLNGNHGLFAHLTAVGGTICGQICKQTLVWQMGYMITAVYLCMWPCFACAIPWSNLKTNRSLAYSLNGNHNFLANLTAVGVYHSMVKFSKKPWSGIK